MKACAVSPWEKASKSDILFFLGETTADLVVLPGESRKGKGNAPSPDEVQRVLQPEQCGHCLLYTSMEDLVKAWRGRTFPVGPSRKVTFAICGEINGFNPDGSAKNGRERELPFDILANPAHYIMGRWQHLGLSLIHI